MKKIFFPVFLFLLFSTGAFAQLKLISLPELQKRISNPDTVYIVNFWATWCGPCVAELPGFGKLQTTYKDKPLKVLLVSMDFMSKQKVVSKFVQSHLVPAAEMYFATRKSDEEFILGIDKNWSGALPGTLVVNGKKGVHLFKEEALAYDELNKLYQTNK